MQFININNTMYNRDHIVGVEMPQWDDEEQEWYFAVIITNELVEFVVGDDAQDCMIKHNELMMQLEDSRIEKSEVDIKIGEESEH